MQTVKNCFKIIDGHCWKLNLRSKHFEAFSKGCSYEFSQRRHKWLFVSVFAFPRFPCGCWLALARCRPGDATLSYLRVTDQICPLTPHFLTGGHHCVMASLSSLSSLTMCWRLSASLLLYPLSCLLSSLVTLASVSSLLSLSGLTTNWWLAAQSSAGSSPTHRPALAHGVWSQLSCQHWVRCHMWVLQCGHI